VVAGAEGPAPQRSVVPGTVLFVGQMSWLPNQEAVRWLCDETLPHIRAACPDVRMLVVGGGAPAELVEHMRASHVEPLGYVEDISGVYDQAAVYAAPFLPFLTGGGVRIKLLDAMREGIPIVTTTAGAKGLDVVAGEHLLIGDSPEQFARAVSGVLADAELAARLATSARQYLTDHHSRGAAVERMREAYAGLPSLAGRSRVPAESVRESERATATSGAVSQR